MDGRPIAPRVAFALDLGIHEITLERAAGDRVLDFFILWLPADDRPWRPLPGKPPPYYPHFF